jgi:peptidoglycan/LPS O-acetylase OafA/YrhL
MMGAYFTPNLMLPLALGAVLAYVKKYNVVFFYNFFKPVYAYIALAVYAVTFYYLNHVYKNGIFNGIFDEYLVAGVSAFFVATASISGFSGPTNFILTNKFSNYIGKISYGVYLIHLFIPKYFFDVFTHTVDLYTTNKKTAWVCYFVLCFAGAALSYTIIEKPINLLKNRFKY